MGCRFLRLEIAALSEDPAGRVVLTWVEKPGVWDHTAGSQHALRPGTLSLSKGLVLLVAPSLGLSRGKGCLHSGPLSGQPKLSLPYFSYPFLLPGSWNEETALGLAHRLL